MNCILKRQFLVSRLHGTLLNAENSQNPIDKCIYRRKGAEWRRVFHFCHMRVGLGQLEEEFRLQSKSAGLSIGCPCTCTLYKVHRCTLSTIVDLYFLGTMNSSYILESIALVLTD